MSRHATRGSTRSAPARSNLSSSSRTRASGSRAVPITGSRAALSRQHRIYDHPRRSTAILAFTSGKFDLTFPYEVTVPLMKDVWLDR
jgi:hypothetical protein